MRFRSSTISRARFDENEAAKDELHRIVARNHGGFDPEGKDIWEEWDTVKNQKTMGKIFTAMDWFLGGVGLVTLALGAIGIINIMLVAVTERTREIGLRKALGATNRNILFQFFLEGAFLTLLSGALGVGGAMLVVHLLSGVQSSAGIRYAADRSGVGHRRGALAGAGGHHCRPLSGAQGCHARTGRSSAPGVNEGNDHDP